ncbi:glycosyltransferase [bacterium]|nr:glycosyltransferase [bacterium]
MKRLRVAFLTTDKREHDRDYLNPVPAFGSAPEAVLAGFANSPDIEVHVVSCTQQKLSAPVRLVDNIYYHSLLVPKIGWLRTFYSGCVWKARRHLASLAPDLVHGQGTERDCALSAVLSGFPNVLTIHGNMAELARLFHARLMSFYWLAARLEDFALSRTAGVFCNSAYTQALVKPRNPKTWLVPNPLGLAFFENPRPHPTRGSIPIFLVIGVVNPRKRQQELLECFRKLRLDGCQFQVRWIGQCPDDPYGKKFLEALVDSSLSDWNFFVGPLDQAGLIREMDAASALVHFPFEESFGLVAAEALARGLKVFSSEVGGLKEICAGSTDAVLIPPEGWTSLRKAIASWIQLGCPPPQESPQIMQARYHPKVIARRHVEIYREVMASR